MSDELKDQINSLIRDEIQDVINDYVDGQGEGGVGFVGREDEKELKVNISNQEVNKLIKEYKKIKKRQKSNLNQVKLLDKHGRQLSKD
tara:strand:- start:57 stop:320 length:264 start_codon:yes stop_codon:yes gene_type:complete